MPPPVPAFFGRREQGAPGRLRIALAVPAFREGARPVQRLDFEILLSSMRQAGHDVVAFDAQVQRLAPDRLVARLAEAKPDLLYWHLEMRDDYEVAAALAGATLVPSPTILAGGYFGTRHDLAILTAVPQIAAIVYGEAEATLAAVAAELAAGRPWQEEPSLTVRRGRGPARNPPRPLLADLDALPMAAADFFSSARLRQGQQVLFSRGCRSDCSYCGLQVPYREQFPGGAGGVAGHWRSRSAAVIVDEIEFYHRRLGVELFRFSSFVFFGYGERDGGIVRAVAQEIVRRGLQIRFSFVTHPGPLLRNRDALSALAAAGLSWVVVGIDTGLDRARALYRLESSREEAREALRLLHLLRIPFTPAFIFYDPYLTLPEVRENLAFIAGLAPSFTHMPPPFGYFLEQHLLRSSLRLGAELPLYERLVKDGLVQPVDPLRADPVARFRDPRVGRLRLLHQRASKELGDPLGRLWCSARRVARFPRLASFPLEIVERLVESLEGDGERSDGEIVEELVDWVRSQLRPCLEEIERGRYELAL